MGAGIDESLEDRVARLEKAMLMLMDHEVFRLGVADFSFAREQRWEVERQRSLLRKAVKATGTISDGDDGA